MGSRQASPSRPAAAGRGRGGRRTLALALGIALPTVLLGAGWTAASLEARASAEREREAILARTASAVRGAVDESLEELRRREDARPFYLYNAFFSPPDVVALNDPIAPSPLAEDPEDPRIVGYFQVEPDGVVRTPYSTEPNGEETERARQVVRRVRSEAYASVRDLSSRDEVRVALAPPEEAAPSSSSIRDWLRTAGPDSAEGWGTAPDSDPPRRRRAPRAKSPPRPSSAPASGAPDAGAAQAELAPQGPLTVALNPWAVEVNNDLQLAQSGSPEANMRVQQRGRAAPRTRRRTVPWEEMQAGQGGDARARPARQQLPRRAAPEPPPAPPVPSLPRPSASEVEVGYTPMAWRAAGDDVVLNRLVSHQGAGVVQGVILDRRYLLDEWIPSIVERHALSGFEPTVVTAGDGTTCALRRPASAVLEGVELCYSAGALAGAAAQLRDDLHLQLAALAGLVLIVTLAGVLMHRTARRAEELSTQKSAFVSAVSHELRTPLTTIRMHAEMLRDGLVPEGRRERFHGQMVQEAVRLSRLVENVLELSRLEEGRRVLDLGEGDLSAHVARVVDEQRHFVEARGFDIVGPDGDAGVVARFDGQAISQIVNNLVDNAVKYGATALPRLVEVVVERAGADAVIRVLDRGPGIPAGERERVFERFHRARDGATEQVPGTGIGLALVKELARAHGGDAEALPRTGGGCEVKVTLPAAP